MPEGFNRFDIGAREGTIQLSEDPFLSSRHARLTREPDGSWSVVDAGYMVANGPAISPDERTLLHTDSARRTVFAFDLDVASGRVARSRNSGSCAAVRPLQRSPGMKRWGVLLATVASCATAPPPEDPVDATGRAGLSAAALRAAAARPEVVAIDGDIALICSEGAPGTDADDGQPDCDAARIGVDGALTELGRGGLIAAGRLDARRLLLLTRDRSLRLRTDATATEIEIARDVADPRLAPDRRAVAFTQLVDRTPSRRG